MTVHLSMRPRGGGRNPRARGEPLIVALELQPESVVEDKQVAVVTADDGIGRNDLHLLRHHADIGLVAAIVAEAIEAKPVIEVSKQDHMVLERDVGAASAATTAAPAAAAATTAATAAHPRAAAADAPAAAAAASGAGAARPRASAARSHASLGGRGGGGGSHGT